MQVCLLTNRKQKTQYLIITTCDRLTSSNSSSSASFFFFFIRTKYQLIILLIGSWILLIYKILAKISKTLTTIVQSYVKDKKFPLFGVHKFSYKFRFLDDDGGKLFAIVHVSAKFSYGLIRHCNSDPVMGNTFFFFIFFYLTKIDMGNNYMSILTWHVGFLL